MRRILLFCVLPLIALMLAVSVADAKKGKKKKKRRSRVKTIAITYFSNNTDDPKNDPLGRGLADMLITDLSQVKKIQVVERSRLNEILKELELQKSKFIDKRTAVRVGKGVGARYVLTGAFMAIDPLVRIDARLVDVRTGKVKQAAEVTGKKEEFFILEKELALKLTKKMGIRLSSRESARLGRGGTENFGAFRSWSKGLAALDRGEVETAKKALEEALSQDASFSAAKDVLSGIEQRVAGLTKRRDKIVGKNVKEILKELKRIKKNKGPYERVPQILDVRTIGGLMPAGSSEVRRIASTVMEMKLSEKIAFELAGVKIGVNEWALATYIQASMFLRQHTDVISYSEVFLKRYPTSSYFQSVQAQMTHAIEAVKKTKAGKGELKKLDADAERMRKRLLCQKRLRPSKRLESCSQWVDLVAAIDDKEEKERALKGLLGAAEKSARLAAIEKAAARIAKIAPDDPRLKSKAASALKKAKRQAERATDVPFDILREQCGHHPIPQERLAGCERWVALAKGNKKELDRALKRLIKRTKTTKGLKKLEKQITATGSKSLERSVKNELERALRDEKRANDLVKTWSVSFGKKVKEHKFVGNARTLYEAGQQKKAEKAVKEGLARWPKSEKLHDLRIRMAYDRWDLASARKAADALAEVIKKNRKTTYLQRMEKVETEQRRFADRHATTFERGAKDYLEAGRVEDARALLEEGLKKWPSNADLHKKAVKLALKQGEVANAKKTYARWKKSKAKLDERVGAEVRELPGRLVEPKSVEPKVLKWLGNQLRLAGQHEEAAKAFHELFRDFPSSGPFALQMAAMMYREAGDNTKARKLYQQLVERFPSSREASTAKSILQTLPR